MIQGNVVIFHHFFLVNISSKNVSTEKLADRDTNVWFEFKLLFSTDQVVITPQIARGTNELCVIPHRVLRSQFVRLE
jgi:hydrogenase maturation factor